MNYMLVYCICKHNIKKFLNNIFVQLQKIYLRFRGSNRKTGIKVQHEYDLLNKQIDA